MVLTSTYPRWAGDHEPAFVHELCKRLLADFRVVVLCSHAPGTQRHSWLDGVEVVRYRYAPAALETLVYGGGIATHLRRAPWKWALVPSFIVSQMLMAALLARRYQPTLVHAHWLLPQGIVAWLLHRLGLIPGYVVTAHGADVYGFRSPILQTIKRMAASRATAMTVVSSAMREEVGRHGLQPRQLEVIPMGADFRERFTPPIEAAREKGLILFIGRLVEKKGLRYLLDAMPQVLRHHPGTRLRVLGFGPLAEALQAQSLALGLGHSVEFRGAVPQSDLPDMLRRAALLVAPSVRADSGDQEGLPVVLMEAVGCGCPILACDTPGVHDLVGRYAGAVLVPGKDPAALAQAIVRLLDTPEQALAIAEGLRTECILRFDWGAIAAAYAALLKRAVCASGVSDML